MKSQYYYFLLLSIFALSCQSNDGSSSPKEENIVFEPIDPLEGTKFIFDNLISGDSIAHTETDSILSYGSYPKDELFDDGKELYGTFIINKEEIYSVDLNGDRYDDLVIKYTFIPHLENNELTYYKVLTQENGSFIESGEIFGGGRCEGPIYDQIDINRRIITLKGQDYAEGDPCCCPTIEIESKYQIVENRITEIKNN